jgi:serine/threonine protein kinase
VCQHFANTSRHRDVKPPNILYIGGAPKIGDIGLVGELGGSATYVAKEGYIPPEGPGTPQADVFGLGKVLYEASTGQDRLAFPTLPVDAMDGPTRTWLAELNEVFVRTCAADPRERYQTAEELHSDLALLHRGRSVRRQRKAARRWRLVSVAGYAAAALAGLAVGLAPPLICLLVGKNSGWTSLGNRSHINLGVTPFVPGPLGSKTQPWRKTRIPWITLYWPPKSSPYSRSLSKDQ